MYDDNKNPYLLFKTQNIEKVKTELKKRIIKAEGAILVKDISSLEKSLKGAHEYIQEKYTPGLLYVLNDN